MKRIAIFQTDTGRSVAAVTAAQMREIDRIAIAGTGPNLYQMMENAGRNLALQALQLLGTGGQKARIVVLAGHGGNGGGGICAARHLANRHADVRLVLSQGHRLGEVPAQQLQIFRATNGTEVEFAALASLHADLIIDAVIGYSLRGAPAGNALALLRWANEHGAPVLALDVPSGLDATTGVAAGECVRADCTMTLALPKTGLVPEKTGDLVLADIGIPPAVYREAGIKYESPFDVRYRIPLSVVERQA